MVFLGDHWNEIEGFVYCHIFRVFPGILGEISSGRI